MYRWLLLGNEECARVLVLGGGWVHGVLVCGVWGYFGFGLGFFICFGFGPRSAFWAKGSQGWVEQVCKYSYTGLHRGMGMGSMGIDPNLLDLIGEEFSH